MALVTPVVFLIFNRPQITRRVFDEIAKARPKKLLVVCDGPRLDREGERELVAATRTVIEHVDWDCDVETNYSDTNLGCKQRVAGGLKWVFQTVEEAIILEDDCLPDASFFPFCDELIERYRDDTRITSICGTNFQNQNRKSRTRYSYYFSKYFHCWGWASWRRVYEQFDLDMTTWPEFRDAGHLADVADSSAEETYWQGIFQRQFDGEINSWAYPWQYTNLTQSGLTVVPEVNLVSNIGFAADATHTDGPSWLSEIPTAEIKGIRDPPAVVRDKAADSYAFRKVFARPCRIKRLNQKIRKQIKRFRSRKSA